MPKSKDSASQFVSWIRQAAPYFHAFRDRTFVIAFGGEILEGGIMEEKAQALAQDLNLLESLGIRLVLVHGARPQIDAEMRRRGLTPRFHKGLRVTDGEALECVKSAMGVARIDLEALLSQGLPNTPMAGGYIRITGGNFITGKPVGVVDGVDYLFTGAVRKVNAGEITADLDQENVVLITPIGPSPSGEVFNLAWEEVAEAVAVALRADKLIYLLDAQGLMDEDGNLLPALTIEEAEALVAAGVAQAPEVGRVLPGALRACRNGVGRLHLLDRNCDGAMLMELFTRTGVGTVVTPSPLARIREATVEDVGAVLALIAPLEADGTLVKRGRERLEMEISRFTLLEHDGVVVGCAALYPYSDHQSAELACVAVMPDYRRAGYGELILDHMEARARKAGLRQVFVLTTRTAHWFLERGFREADLEALPQEKRDMYNLQRRSKVLVRPVGRE